MIDYELAKKLKDAGFPQKEYGFYGDGERYQFRETHDPYEPNNRTMWVRYYSEEWIQNHLDEIVYFPSLSELIEACGSYFDFLQNKEDSYGWRAVSGGGEEGSGSSPETAVANLWLALNG